MHNIQIDNEFKSLIPPLSAEERAQLEANIVADGCRDPLVLWAMPTHTVDYSEEQDGSDVETFFWNEAEIVSSWDEKNGDESYRQWRDEDGDLLELFEDEWPCILIDGHNRYEICTRLDLPFETVFKDFAGRDDAIEWIINNQFGRRNLSDYQRGVLALRMKPIMEDRARAQQGERTDIRQKSDEGIKPIRTDEAVSELANVSRDTIRKIERIEEVAQPEVKALAAAGEVSINLASQFTDLPPEVQQEAIAAIAEQNEPAKEVMREAVHNHRAQGTGENEWYTPQEHIDAAYAVLGGVDLDPASSEIANQRVKAGKIFTIADDGLTKEWGGKVWMNPTACTCGVHPKLIESPDEYQNLPELSAGLAEHIRLLLGADGNSAPVLMVQGLQPREGKASTSSAAQIRNRENQAPGRKSQIRPEREGQACEAKAVGDGQPQAPIPSDCGPISVDDGALGASEGGMGPCLRILRGDDGTIDTGSFHSFVTSCVSGDIAKKYGSGLPELQFQQGGSDAGRLAYGQAAHCPNCRLVGYAVDKPSRVFMNPPYAQPHIANFIEKLASEYESGKVSEAIALTHNYTDTQWFHRAANSCAAICFTRGRIGFLSPEGKRAAPTQGQAFFYFGDKVNSFAETFRSIGFVVEVRHAG